MHWSARYLAIITGCAAAALAGCGRDAAGPEITLDSLTLAPDSILLDAWGLAYSFDVRAYDATGRVYTQLPFEWRSSDTSVARVDPAGIVTTVGDGRTTISVSGYGHSADAVVTVAQRPSRIAMSLARDSVMLGDTVRATAQVLDRAGTRVPAVTVSWRSIYPEYATVDSTGLIHAIRSGRAEIGAWLGAIEASATLAIGDTAFIARRALAGKPSAVARSSTGVMYVTQIESGRVSRLSIDPPAIVSTFDVGMAPRAVSFTADGSRAFVVLQTEPAIAMVDVGGDSVLSRYPVAAVALDVAAMPDTTAYFLTDWADGATTCFFKLDPTSADPIIPIQTSGILMTVIRDPVRPRLYVAGPGGFRVFRTDTEEFSSGVSWAVGGRMVVTPDGRYLFGVASGGLRVVDLEADSLVGTIDVGASALAVTSDGQRAYLATQGLGEIIIVDVPNRILVRYMDFGGSIHDVAIAGDSVLVAANEEGWVDFVRAER